MIRFPGNNWLARQRILPAADRIGGYIFIASLTLLVFFYGFVSAYLHLFPFRIFEGALQSVAFMLDVEEGWGKKFPDFIYYDMTNRKKYKDVLRDSKFNKEITALDYFSGTSIYLVDSAGRVLHAYHLRVTNKEKKEYFNLLEKDTKHLDTGKYLYIQDFHLYANGDALMMLTVAGKVWPFGVGFVKVDKDSNILWASIQPGTHHGFDVSEDGRIFALAHEMHKAASKAVDSLPTPYIDDYVLILGKDGKRLDRINLLQAIHDSKYSFYLTEGDLLPLANVGPKGDYLHANDVNFITAKQAKVFPYGNEGDLLVSMRNIHAIGVLDIKKRKFTWMKRGPWVAQHDPDILPNGDLMIFDNLGDTDVSTGRSRVIEFDPRTERVVWSYTGTAQDPFESEVRGSQQYLPNGNVLISETMGGRVFEVTRSGKTVWQFVAPFRFGNKGQYVSAIRWPERLPLSYFTKDFRASLEHASETAEVLGIQPTKHAAR